MLRTSLIGFLTLVLVALAASDCLAQEASPYPSGIPSGPQAAAKPESKPSDQTKDKAEGKSGGKSEGPKADTQSQLPPPILLPQILVIGKVEALCAAERYLVKIRPFGPQFAGVPPCPPWLVVNSKNTPEATSLLLKAAEKDWLVGVYFDPTWTVTAVCVRLPPRDGD